MQKVLITGANRGLGYELVRKFLDHNYYVYALVRSLAGIKKLEKDFHNTISIILGDVTQESVITIIEDRLKEDNAALDIVINNAGIPGKESSIDTVTADEISLLFNTHCLGPVRVIKACLQFLEKADKPIVFNITSRFGSLNKISTEYKDRQVSYSYRIAKAAQNMFTLCLANEMRGKNIIVNSIHPGKVKTESGAYDADIDPEFAAELIYDWAQECSLESTGKFLQPYSEVFPW